MHTLQEAVVISIRIKWTLQGRVAVESLGHQISESRPCKAAALLRVGDLNTSQDVSSAFHASASCYECLKLDYPEY